MDGFLGITSVSPNVNKLFLVSSGVYLTIALRTVTIYRPETQTNKLKLTSANSSLLSDFCH